MTKLTISQACGFLGNISRATLYRRLKDHKVATERSDGGEIVVPLSELERVKHHHKRKAMMKAGDLANILDRLSHLESAVERLSRAIGINDASRTYRPQEAPLFRKLVQEILSSEELQHKYEVLRAYLERMPASKAADVFDDPKALITAYYKMVKYLSDNWKLIELEELLRLRGRIEIISALTMQSEPSTDAEQRCPDGGTQSSKP